MTTGCCTDPSASNVQQKLHWFHLMLHRSFFLCISLILKLCCSFVRLVSCCVGNDFSLFLSSPTLNEFADFHSMIVLILGLYGICATMPFVASLYRLMLFSYYDYIDYLTTMGTPSVTFCTYLHWRYVQKPSSSPSHVTFFFCGHDGYWR